MKPLKDATHLYEVENRHYHADRENFRIVELQISKDQKIPWHKHSTVVDIFYVWKGALTIYLQDPKEKVHLQEKEMYAVEAGRPHLVTNALETSTTFFVIQDGDYDNIQLT